MLSSRAAAGHKGCQIQRQQRPASIYTMVRDLDASDLALQAVQ